MSKGADWNWDSLNSLQAAAGWALKKAGPKALMVVVVRVDDFAIAADPQLAPREVLNLFEDRCPDLMQYLEQTRIEAIKSAQRKAEKGIPS